MSGRRGSNSPPIAWKAIALPNELLPLELFTTFNFEPSTLKRAVDESRNFEDELTTFPNTIGMLYPSLQLLKSC